jgi:hypothetical protein
MYISTLLAVRLLEHCLRFALSCYSYVSIPSTLEPGPSFPSRTLIEASSIAIWNKNKIAVTIASSVWVTNVVTAGMGKSAPFPHRISGTGVTYKRDINQASRG